MSLAKLLENCSKWLGSMTAATASIRIRRKAPSISSLWRRKQIHTAIEVTIAAIMEARDRDTKSRIRQISSPAPRRYFSPRVSAIRNPQSRNGVMATPITAPRELGLYQKAQPAAYKSPGPEYGDFTAQQKSAHKISFATP